MKALQGSDQYEGAAPLCTCHPIDWIQFHFQGLTFRVSAFNHWFHWAHWVHVKPLWLPFLQPAHFSRRMHWHHADHKTWCTKDAALGGHIGAGWKWDMLPNFLCMIPAHIAARNFTKNCWQTSIERTGSLNSAKGKACPSTRSKDACMMVKYPFPVLFGFCSATGVWIKTHCLGDQVPLFFAFLDVHPKKGLNEDMVFLAWIWSGICCINVSQKFARFRPTTTPTSWWCGSRILRSTRPLRKKLRQAQLHRGNAKTVSYWIILLFNFVLETHFTMGWHLEMEADHVVFPSVGCLTESWNGSKAGEHQPGPTSTWGLLAASLTTQIIPSRPAKPYEEWAGNEGNLQRLLASRICAMHGRTPSSRLGAIR